MFQRPTVGTGSFYIMTVHLRWVVDQSLPRARSALASDGTARSAGPL